MYFMLPVLMSNVACVLASSSLDDWVENKTDKDENLLCKLEHNDNYFLASESDGRLKVAYRIDVTSSTNKPKSFILRWEFQNENNEYIGLNVSPEVIDNGYVTQGDKIFAEEVSYRNVFLNDSKRLKINIGLKKYISSDDVPSSRDLNDNDLEKISFCDTPSPILVK